MWNVASSTGIITTTITAIADHLYALMNLIMPFTVEIAVLFLAFHLIKRLVRGRGIGR